MTKKKAIIAGIAAIVFIALLLVGYLTKEKPAEQEAPMSEVITVQGLVDTTPEEVWAEPDEDGHGGFTTRDQLPADDESIGVLTIDAIGLQCHVYDSDENTVMEDMKRGVAHYKSTSYWLGNVGLSAHNGNASYSFFDKLPQLAEGDVLTYETALGTRQYAVASITEIADDDWSLLERTEDNRLTLTTCITGQPSKRLCVQAVEI